MYKMTNNVLKPHYRIFMSIPGKKLALFIILNIVIENRGENWGSLEI